LSDRASKMRIALRDGKLSDSSVEQSQREERIECAHIGGKWVSSLLERINHNGSLSLELSQSLASSLDGVDRTNERQVLVSKVDHAWNQKRSKTFRSFKREKGNAHQLDQSVLRSIRVVRYYDAHMRLSIERRHQ